MGTRAAAFSRTFATPSATLPFNASLADLMSAVRQQRLEGLLAQRLDSVYEPDRRSSYGVAKMRVNRSQEFKAHDIAAR